jgi:N-acylneuraminate cytidylyltransferase
MAKTIAIIPARGGSKRLPGKNIRALGDLPLIAHSILYAKANTMLIDEVYVTTDDAAIKAVAEQYGAKVIDRPAPLSTDYQPTVSALKHVLETLVGDIENVVLLQPTNPLRPANLLQQAFEVFTERNCKSLFTVTRNHHKLGKIQNDRFMPFNYEIGQRSQDLEPLYFENGLLYISKASLILTDKILDENAVPMVVNHIFAQIDIDTQDDHDYAAYLLSKNKESKS